MYIGNMMYCAHPKPAIVGEFKQMASVNRLDTYQSRPIGVALLGYYSITYTVYKIADCVVLEVADMHGWLVSTNKSIHSKQADKIRPEG